MLVGAMSETGGDYEGDGQVYQRRHHTNSHRRRRQRVCQPAK